MDAELRLRAEGLDWREVHGRMVVLLPGDAGEIVLNRGGTVLWRLIAEGTSRGALCARLVESFGIDAAAAERDVEAFLSALRARELLDAGGPRGCRPPPG